MFKKGDYIVLTAGNECAEFKNQHIFKQAKDHDFLSVEKDLLGDKNGWAHYQFKKKTLYAGEWRYATQHEILLYDTFDRPVHTKITVEAELTRTTNITFHLPRV
jgi:hypothetical protein